MCPRMTSIRIALFVFVHRRGHHAFRESSCVSLAHGPRWLFLLSRHRKAISAAANQKPFVNKDFVHQEICETNYQSGESHTPCFGLATKMSGSFSRELDQYSYND